MSGVAQLLITEFTDPAGGIELDDAREQHLGFDGLWSLPDWAAPEVGGRPSNGAVATAG